MTYINQSLLSQTTKINSFKIDSDKLKLIRAFSQTTFFYTKKDTVKQIDILTNKVTSQSNEITSFREQITDCAYNIFEKQTPSLVHMQSGHRSIIDTEWDKWNEKTDQCSDCRKDLIPSKNKSPEDIQIETSIDKEQIKADITFTKVVKSVFDCFSVPIIEENRESHSDLVTTIKQLEEKANNLISQQEKDINEIIKLENEVKQNSDDDNGEGSSNQQDKLENDQNQTSNKYDEKDDNAKESSRGSEVLGGGNSTGPVNFKRYLEIFLVTIIETISSILEYLNNFFM